MGILIAFTASACPADRMRVLPPLPELPTQTQVQPDELGNSGILRLIAELAQPRLILCPIAGRGTVPGLIFRRRLLKRRGFVVFVGA